MPLAIAMIVVGILLFFLFFAIAHESPPAPADVAIAYETAWDRLDFSMLFDLSGPELRDGMRREPFIAAKRAAYAQGDHDRGRLGARIEVDTAVTGHDTALVVTRVSHGDSAVRNNVLLERRGGSWTVVGYNLRPEPDPSTPTR
jgi:hypothetical protein